MSRQTARVRGSGYQIMLVGLLSINFGILFFDRNALNFLMPLVKPELGLDNFQVGLTASGLSFTWAIAAFAIGYISDKTGTRKALLVAATLCFSACSFLSGLAGSFAMLLGTRLIMGAAEGGVMPMTQSIIAAEVASENRGLAMGVSQNFGSNLLGSFVAPVVLVAFAEAFGWRNAFFLAGIPGIISALLIWFLIDEPEQKELETKQTHEPSSLGDVLAERNIVLCALMGILLVGYLVICWAFMPLYLTRVRGIDPETMSWLMGTLGISATIGAFVVSYISDRIGRRPVMILLPLIGVILPLGAMYFTGSLWMLAAIFFVGWGLVGIFPLFMGTVPSESVDARHLATVLGLCMGTPEVFGGVLAPSLAGKAADLWGSDMPLWIMTGITIVSSLLALGLRETAPRVLAGRSAARAYEKTA